MSNHLYTLSISRFSSDKSWNLINNLPSRYFRGYTRCGDTDATLPVGIVPPQCGSLGVHSIGFRFNSTDANAFRKWIQRRYGYRATFRRAVNHKQNWVQAMLFDYEQDGAGAGALSGL